MSRANVRVRPAAVDDIPALTALIQDADPITGAFSGRPLEDPSVEHLRTRLAEMLDLNERTILIATDDAGEVAGMLVARSDEIGAIDMTPVLHVTHLIVARSMRRRGIGRALLVSAVHLADETGIENVLTTAAAGSREGNRYLARIGFAPLVVHRIASTSVLRRSLGMTDVAGRMAVLRRARLVRAQRSGFSSRTVGRGA
ncbi:MAG: GNAT family N-acetyltransferase [Jatrophihabitans sp.]